MPFEYNISDLISKAFGVTGSILPLSGADLSGYVSQKLDGYTEINKADYGAEKKQLATSYLGTPIIMPVSFDTVQWSVIEDGKKVKRRLPQLTLPPAVLVDFSQAKIIEKTRIAGKDGTVKEYIGLDDWSIRIRGIAINEEKDEAPEKEIKKLKALKNCPVAIPILNDMCEWLDIYDVTIDDVEFTSLEGYPGAQPFTITMSSDAPFLLKYKNRL